MMTTIDDDEIKEGKKKGSSGGEVVVVKANCSRTGLRKYEKGKQTKKKKIIPKDLRWRKRGGYTNDVKND